MRTKIFSVILCLSFVLSTNVIYAQKASNNTMNAIQSKVEYSTLWNEVSRLEKQSLPQSILEKVEIIYQKSLSEKNSPELIKAMLYNLKYNLSIDKDRFPEIISEIEKYTTENKDVVEQCVLFSILSQLYAKYYENNAYLINERTILTGYVPEDIKEWTGNIFIEKIVGYVHLSLSAERELKSTDVLKYSLILSEGKSSRNLRPTLYDFLIYQGIELFSSFEYNYASRFFRQNRFPDVRYFAPVTDFVRQPITGESYDFSSQTLMLYQRLLSFRLQDSAHVEALLMADLGRLEFVYNHTENDDKEKFYPDALSNLEKQYESQNFCVEVLYKMALTYYNQSGGIIRPLTDEGAEDVNEPKRKVYLICNKGIEKYPDYERINLLKNLKEQLTQPRADIRSDNTIYPGKPLKLNISYQNIENLVIEIYKINAPVSVYDSYSEKAGQYTKTGTLIDKKIMSLRNTDPYLASDTVVEIFMDRLGNYEYVIYSEKDKKRLANQQFSVSRFTAVSRAYDNKYEFLVVDRMSGKPVEGASVNLYKRNENANGVSLSETLITKKSGLAEGVHDRENSAHFYNVSAGTDTSLPLSPAPWEQMYPEEAKLTMKKLDLFTDRSLYRPGQTVFFKGLAYEVGDRTGHVVNNQTYTVYLQDPNGKKITSGTFKTSGMGSFSGEFTLPQSGLNGIFRISTEDYSSTALFHVEEYKRPSFDIVFEQVKETYNFGDTVTVTGTAKTFSGVNIQDTPVEYRIIERPHWLWRWSYRGDTEVANGTAKTDHEGVFRIAFPAEKHFSDRKQEPVFYTYEVQATITDSKGETQETSTFISIGDRSMFLSGGPEGPIQKEHLPQVVIHANNLNNQSVICKGSYEIYSLKGTELLGEEPVPGELETDRLIDKGNFTTGDSINIQTLKTVPSGRYRMIVKASDDKNREVSAESDFILFSVEDKRPPVTTYEWIVSDKTSCDVGENAEIYYGSSAKEVYVLYEIFKNDEKLESSRFILNNNIKKLEIPFLESYGDEITVKLTFIKDAKFFNQNIPVKKKEEDKNLILNMDVFRDKLLPGQTEEWKLTVRDAQGQPVDGEVLAGMYDISLDKIYAHNWSFYPLSSNGGFSPYFYQSYDFQTEWRQIYFPLKNRSIPSFSFDSFNWFGLTLNDNLRVFQSKSGSIGSDVSDIRVGGRLMGAVAEERIATDAVLSAPVMGYGYNSTSTTKTEIAMDQSVVPTGSEQGGETVHIRENFNETAFFYPQLKTNTNGETVVSFNVPESNTTWKFMALSHTKDLKYGQLVKKAVSQKKLMVNPNIPRFIRHGDKMTLTTGISNLSDNNIKGIVSLTFFDPVTEKQSIAVAQSEQNFAVDAGKTAKVSWTFEVPSGIDITACKIVARSTGFSDGEQHLLPVLANQMLVTESLPLTVSGNETKVNSFDKLIHNKSETLENYRLTLEFAGNPVWYAIQALPAITTPINDNVLSWFAAFYTNSLAGFLANHTPEIKTVIDLWTKQEGGKEALLSDLEKNPELKNMLLEETPWVMEAGNETEQKQRLSLLFDVNRSNNLSISAINKLRELQIQDGGWSWFKDMSSSVSITQWILYGLGQLESLNVPMDANDLDMLKKRAIAFIDKEFAEHFEQLKKSKLYSSGINTISTYELEYLFVRSFYIREEADEVTQEAIRFYTGIAEKNWTKNNLYEQAITAIILKRSGNIKTAGNILNSLRQHATYKEDRGMYWANNDTKAFMFQSATAVHTFIMQAFHEVGSDEKEMDNLKFWLLSQKQMQEWESVPATVNAISVLLQSGSNWLKNEGSAEILLGDKKIKTENKEVGIGYLKQVFEASEINPDMGKITITKQDDGPAWGALYWQYYEQLDKITEAKTGLNVEKKLFIEEVSETGRSLDPVTGANPLKIGDKAIVRLTIRNDRDMEYVMLKDMRASCFEPAEQLSGTKWKEKVIYYQTTKDASTNFYFYNLPKGTYVLEYPVYATRSGDYSGGIATIQCMYAPQYVSHTSGEKVIVKE